MKRARLLFPVLVLTSMLAASKPASVKLGSLVTAARMNTARAIHSATLLADGRVLIAGGLERNHAQWDSAEIYDPARNAFQPAGKMSAVRGGQAAVRLQNGKVLILGGWTADSDGSAAGTLATCELFDPATGKFSPAATMHARRGRPSAMLLKDGRVLVAGGEDGEVPLASAEIYDPNTNQFTMTGALAAPRANAAEALLPDGRVLIVGGRRGDRQIVGSAEIYDPRTSRFTPTGSLHTPRYKHTAITLPDGKVLVVGGSDARDFRGEFDSAEIYDPAHGTFSDAGKLNAARFKLTNAVLLSDGRVLIAGGADSVEIYDPAAHAFTTAPGKLDTARFYDSVTLLKDGRVLITGGYGGRDLSATNQAWIYQP